MTAKLYKPGDRVSFRGSAGTGGEMLSAQRDGETVFEATVHGIAWGVCYNLRWDDNSPVGLPFHDFQLKRV